MRRTTLSLVVFFALFLTILQSVDGQAISSDVQGNHYYTAAELAELPKDKLSELIPKEQLIEMILNRQKAGMRGIIDEPQISATTLLAMQPHKRRGFVPIVGAVAGGLAIMSVALMSRHTNQTTQPPGLATASRRRLFDTAPTAAAASCNTAVQFSCGPYPSHQMTCNALSVLTTTQGTVSPILASKGQPQVSPTTAPPPNGSFTGTYVNDKPYNITGTGPSSSQQLAAGLGLGVHLLQILGNCTNGAPEVGS